MDDLNKAYARFLNHPDAAGQAIETNLDMGFGIRARELHAWAESSQLQQELEYWHNELQYFSKPIAATEPPAWRYSGARSCSLQCSQETTADFLEAANQAYQTVPEELLLAAAARAWSRSFSENNLLIAMESHGRDVLDGSADTADLSRTVGWFTSLFPLVLQLQGEGESHGHDLKTVKDARRLVPAGGIGYGVARYLVPDADTRERLQISADSWTMCFNYLGRFSDESQDDSVLLAPTPEPSGVAVSPNAVRPFRVEFSGVVFGDRLQISVTFDSDTCSADAMECWLSEVRSELDRIIEHCCGQEHTELTSSDLTLVETFCG